MLSSLSSSSGSFDSAAFARYMLEPDSEGCTPPRITRFSFEDEEDRGNLTTSFSGQFSSFYGLPYDSSPPPEESSQYAASEHSSRGPSTPSAPSHLPLPLDPSSPLALSMKPFDDPCMQDTTSLFLDPHSLQPGQSLLSDTPSYLGLVSTRSGELPSRPSRSHSQTMVRPTPPPTTVPTRQTIPSNGDCSRLTNHNRGVTVQQLALEIPMSRSSSGSLSTLIHALEDASPGWYQSLMDSALPNQVLSPLCRQSLYLWRQLHDISLESLVRLHAALLVLRAYLGTCSRISRSWKLWRPWLDDYLFLARARWPWTSSLQRSSRPPALRPLCPVATPRCSLLL